MIQRILGLAGAVMLATALPAAAQVRGLPVYNPGVPTGIGIFGDIGFSNANAGKARTYAATGRAGFGPLGLTATLGIWDPSGATDSRTVAGATANLRVFGGGLLPISVTMQAGYGYLKLADSSAAGPASTEQRFPIGVGVAVNIPTPAVSIKPWIAPRLDIVRAKVLGVSGTDTNFGASGGIEVNSLTGFGLQASYDWVRSSTTGNRGIFAVGLHTGLRVPGL